MVEPGSVGWFLGMSTGKLGYPVAIAASASRRLLCSAGTLASLIWRFPPHPAPPSPPARWGSASAPPPEWLGPAQDLQPWHKPSRDGTSTPHFDCWHWLVPGTRSPSGTDVSGTTTNPTAPERGLGPAP